MRLEITIHIGQIIGVSAIFAFTNKVKNGIFNIVSFRLIHLSVFGTKAISSRYFGPALVTLFFQENVEISI